MQLERHTADLIESGIGEVSSMMHEVLAAKMETNPREFVSRFSEEGPKFTRMVMKIVPPGLAAEYVRRNAESEAPILPVYNKQYMRTVFDQLKKMIEESLRDKCETNISLYCKFMKYCVRHPEMMLSFMYLSSSLGQCSAKIGKTLHDPVARDIAIERIPRHFASTNMELRLPTFAYLTLETEGKVNGQSFCLDQRDIQITFDRLKEYDAFDRTISVPDNHAGERANATVVCPMRGYVERIFLQEKLLMTCLELCRRLSAGGSPRNTSHVVHALNKQNLIYAISELCESIATTMIA